MGGARHFFLDTGLYHSLACTLSLIGTSGLDVLRGHEANATIDAEVARQRTGTSLGATAQMLVPAMRNLARDACDLARDTAEVETIRNELLADSRLRHPDAEITPSTAAGHAGEAELIHLAGKHAPTSVIFCNDAGASAVARRRQVSSAHFLHVVRAVVKTGLVEVEDAVGVAEAGLSESGLQAAERARTLNEAWLTGSVSRPSGGG